MVVPDLCCLHVDSKKTGGHFDVTEINGASEPEALQLSIPLSSRLKNILLSSEEGILDFSGRRTS